MSSNEHKRTGKIAAAMLVLALAMPGVMSAKKKKEAPAPATEPKKVDYSRLQFPPAPEIARIRYLGELYGAKLMDVIQEGMQDPVGLAIDTENRFLYVVDMELDQVLVYDADTYKLLRKIGTTGHKHELTTPGDFGSPHSAAVDKDGNLYVTDMLNNRVEVFDAEGNFIRTFGKLGDAVGDFGRPKGIAVDGDGHVWVVDQVLDRVTIFGNEGQALMGFGTHGKYAGQFKGLSGITIDKQNRVFTVEQYPTGKVQVF